jgi:hypothetical protein
MQITHDGPCINRRVIPTATSGLPRRLDLQDGSKGLVGQGVEEAVAGAEKSLDLAKAQGWTVVSMKNDWKKIFSFE